MALDESVRNRVIFLGGKVAGLDCPNCQFESRNLELNTYTLTNVVCPYCGTTILTKDQKSQLRQAGKL